jgi:hypothetical protein
MEVITIEKQAFKRIINSIAEMKLMIAELAKKSTMVEPVVALGMPRENWITIRHACEKYNISKVTLNSKRRLFERIEGREMKRCLGGRKTKLFDESELVKAIQLNLNDTKLKKFRNGKNL